MMEYHQTEGKPRHVTSTEETSNSHTTFAATCISASKGFWAELLGVGDFYYEVGSQMKHQKQTNDPLQGTPNTLLPILHPMGKKYGLQHKTY